MTFITAIAPVVPNIDSTLRRFSGDMAFWERSVLNFSADPNYADFCHAMQAGDRTAAEHAAHALKGTASNLGFDALFDAGTRFVLDLRAGKSDLSADAEALHIAYRTVLDAIAQIER